MGSEESQKIIRVLQNLSCEERLRELALFILEKRRLHIENFVSFQCIKRIINKEEKDFLQGPIVIEQDTMDLFWRR